MFHVKPQGHQLDPAAVEKALGACGVSVTTLQASRLARHADLVLEANQSVNLTRIVDPQEVLYLHIVDSLAFLSLIPSPEGTVVDVGSGAGYPGVPLSIMGHRVTLCESVQKKAQFLQSVVEDLHLDAEVLALRAEEIALERRGAFTTVLARAVSSLPALLELASPLLQRGGHLIALKGAPDKDELEKAERAAKILGFRLSEDHVYQLPRGENRRVLVYQKLREPRIALPRRPGSAQRHPLG